MSLSTPIDAACAGPAIPERLNLVLLGLASVVSATLLFGASHAGSGWLFVACAMGFSFTANTLFSLLHEAVHGIFSSHSRVNEWAGRWAAAWFPTGFAIQRAFHLTHHRNNRSATEQFDVLHPGDVKWLKRAQWYAILTGLYWPVAVCGVLVHLLLTKPLRARMLRLAGHRAAEQTSARAYSGALDALDPVASRLEVLGSVAFQLLLFWLLDLSVIGWAACYAAFAVSWSSLQYTDHAFSPLDPRTGAWNLQVSPLVRGLFLNYHFHLAHHQRPWLPWNQLAAGAEAGPRFIDVWWQCWRGPRPAGQSPRFAVPDRSPPRWWRWPAGADGQAALVFSMVFLAVFAVFFGGASILSGFVPWHAKVAFPFELAIPFEPRWSIVYLSLIPLLLLLPLARPRWQDLLPVFGALVAETVVASLFFIALPVQSSFPPRDAAGEWNTIFQLADTLNLDGNLFPSLHVAFAVTAMLALAPTVSAASRLLLVAWVGLITASTLLIHEHHLVDVVAGALLALLSWHIVSRWAAQDDVVAAADVELLCLANQVLFVRRHQRYGLIALLLLVDRLRHWRRRRVLSTGFCFLQAVDDVMDGDRRSSQDPLALVDALMHALRHDRFGDDELMRLAKAFVSDLRRVGQPDAIDNVLSLMAVMRTDRCRVVARVLWSRDQLREHHRKTFTFSLDLLLAARGCELRAGDVPELVEAFGWCSAMRDLREDLGAGLVNVPGDVVRAAGMDGARPTGTGLDLDLDRLMRSDAMRAWMESERARALDLLDAMQPRLDRLKQRSGAQVLRIFTRSIRSFAARRFEHLYPSLKKRRSTDQPRATTCH